jgi:hypothetical protein
MATDTNILQGEVSENPSKTDMDVERLIVGFLRSLLDEQRQPSTETTTLQNEAYRAVLAIAEQEES